MKLLAIVTLLAFAPFAARAQERTYTATEPAPEKSATLSWCDATGKCASGFWYSDAQIVKVSQRISSCEDTLGTCLFDKQVAESKASIPAWVWIGIGMAVTGVAWAIVGATTK